MTAVASFELGISLGEIAKVRYELADVPALDDAFTWFVRCQGDTVTIHALFEGKVREIGRAAWVRGRLIERVNTSPGFPNDHQWKMVGTALSRVMRRAFAGVEGAPVWRRALAQVDPKSRPVLVGAIVLGLVAIGITVMIFRVRTKEPVIATAPAPSPTPAPAPPPAPSPTSAPSPPPPHAPVATTFAGAIAEAKPAMGDGLDNAGAWQIARFAKLVWSDVEGADETTVPLVLKDSERERGRRLCVTGAIADIERQDLDGRPVHVGALRTTDGDDVRFIVLGSTGMLVKRSAASLCGVATGKHAKAAVIVGLFDLPENRAPSVER